jgi:hypothetical protein
MHSVLVRMRLNNGSEKNRTGFVNWKNVKPGQTILKSLVFGCPLISACDGAVRPLGVAAAESAGKRIASERTTEARKDGDLSGFECLVTDGWFPHRAFLLLRTSGRGRQADGLAEFPEHHDDPNCKSE